MKLKEARVMWSLTLYKSSYTLNATISCMYGSLNRLSAKITTTIHIIGILASRYRYYMYLRPFVWQFFSVLSVFSVLRMKKNDTYTVPCSFFIVINGLTVDAVSHLSIPSGIRMN